MSEDAELLVVYMVLRVGSVSLSFVPFAAGLSHRRA